MAEKTEHDGGAKPKPKKKHLHQIVTTFAHDKTAMHEHVYKDHKDDHHSHPPVFAGTSQNMEDLHQHMDDHAGPVMQPAAEEEAGQASAQPGPAGPGPGAAEPESAE